MTDLNASFWAKVRKTDYCWLWQGAQNSKGYGVQWIDGVVYLAHRLAYEDTHGPIPDGMGIDHLCRTRNCVNPSAEHLEVVTAAENNRRRRAATSLAPGDECINGHQLTQDGIYVHPRGHTECRTCRREQKAASKRAA